MPSKTCQTWFLTRKFDSSDQPQCEVARSLCKSMNGSVFQTVPVLFEHRLLSCSKLDAEFCEFI